jgi:hypothetical protein
MCVTDASSVLYDGAIFSPDPTNKDAPLPELFSALMSPRPDDRAEALAAYETNLLDYIKTSHLFQNEKSLADPKALERKITYFCMSELSISAVSFLDVTEFPASEIEAMMPPRRGGKDEPGSSSESDAQGNEGPSSPDVVIACDPVMDPVGGVAAGELPPGTAILCKLRGGSVFYNLMEKASPSFDGTVKGDVTAVNVNDLGTAIIALKLSDGVTGAIKVAGTVRLKVSSKADPINGAPKHFGVEVVLAAAGVIVFLCVMALLLYLLS